jgi:hypothetical protein
MMDGHCGGVQLSEQEDLMVWMHTAALPRFRKLYRLNDPEYRGLGLVLAKVQSHKSRTRCRPRFWHGLLLIDSFWRENRLVF